METQEKIKVRVGWGDILLGTRKNGNTCAIARAVKRQFPGKNVKVGLRDFDISNGKTVVYRMPDNARDFVTRFDHAGKLSVRPFTFEATLK